MLFWVRHSHTHDVNKKRRRPLAAAPSVAHHAVMTTGRRLFAPHRRASLHSSESQTRPLPSTPNDERDKRAGSRKQIRRQIWRGTF